MTLALLTCLLLAAGAPAEPAGDFDFDLLPTSQAQEPPRAAIDLKQDSVTLRRNMLQVHQVVGLSTLGALTAAVVLGQLNYADLYGGNGRRLGNYRMPHRILAYTATGGFLATASLSLFAPTPYPRASHGIEPAVLHRATAALASAGMLTQIVLGFVTARSADAGNRQRLADLALAHQVVGYVTVASLATAATVWVF